jgi:hypothetical protein
MIERQCAPGRTPEVVDHVDRRCDTVAQPWLWLRVYGRQTLDNGSVLRRTILAGLIRSSNLSTRTDSGRPRCRRAGMGMNGFGLNL